MIDAVALAGAAVLLAGSLLVTVPVPWGGRVPMGITFAVAVAALLPAGRLAAVDAAALVLAVAVRHRSVGRGALAPAGRWALTLAVTGAAAAAVDDVLTAAVVAAAAAVVVDAGWTLAKAPGAPVRLRSALPVHLTLACAGVLLAVAVDEVGAVLASVVVLPLVVTRVAFGRYAEATETLQQTVQALGLVPELAGLAPLGHSERAAWYASAIAGELGLDRPSVDRIVTATRLHHLGAVRHEDADAPTSPSEVAVSGARILRQSGFPEDVADLLESARADGQGESPSLAAAVVRVAAAFDHAVEDDPTATDRGLALLSSISRDPHGRRAAAALLALVATRPTLVEDAVAAGARFRDAADGLDLGALVGERAGGAVLPFTHRPTAET